MSHSNEDSRARNRRALWAEFGLAPPERLDDDQAPPVDLELLRRLDDKDLTPEEVRVVLKLVRSYQSWEDAHVQVTLQGFRRRFPNGL